jgi:Ca-activated chloride channel family protein
LLTFANPLFLLLLPLPLGLFFWWLGRRRAALRFSELTFFGDLPRGRAGAARIIGALTRSLAVVCLIIAAAGPRLPDLKTRIPTEGVAIVIVLDVSGSMETDKAFVWQQGSAPISRREAARRAFHLFVEGGEASDGTRFEGRSTERGSDAIGLVTFTNYPQPVCPPTLNHSVLLHILDHTRPVSIRDEGSNVGDAIAQGLIMLEKSTLQRKAIILLSDGESNFDREEELTIDGVVVKTRPMKPRQAAQLAANLGIRVYTIDTGGDPPVNAKKDEIQQREEGRAINEAVAKLTNGRSFDANDGRQLLEVCRTIDSLERQPILSNTYRRYRQLYPWFTGVGVALLIVVFVAELTVWRRLP